LRDKISNRDQLRQDQFGRPRCLGQIQTGTGGTTRRRQRCQAKLNILRPISHLSYRESDPAIHTPFTTLVPTLVTKPLTFSDRSEDSTKVEPGSLGASKTAHSCKPSFSEASESCIDCRSHSNSRA
jgi:hypothetical protein